MSRLFYLTTQNKHVLIKKEVIKNPRLIQPV